MLGQRIVTALILLPLVLAGLFFLESEAFSWFVAGIAAVDAWEWARLAGLQTQPLRLIYALAVVLLIWLLGNTVKPLMLYAAFAWWVLAFGLVLTFPATQKIWKSVSCRLFLGVFILLPFWAGVVFLRGTELSPFPDLSALWLVFYALFVVFAADTGAYFSGKAWGRAKLAPKVSPGKSWAGFWGGIASSSALALIAGYILDASLSLLLQMVLVTAITAAFSVVGDLTESMFKRNEGVKDSSQLLPGHGGVLDRIDSLTAAFPVLACLLLFIGWA